MKILVVHNSYQQHGGEDVARDAEARLLRRAGHAVIEYSRSNSDLIGASFPHQLTVASETLWSRRSFRELRALLAREKPHVAHFHNTFPLISPSAYHACADAGVPVVQTLHNYRLLCPGATFFRAGQACEKCLRRPLAWPAVFHACYRNSRGASSVAALLPAVHRAMGTWRRNVAVYLALSEFARQKFIEGGLPAEKIVVKPNFVTDAGPAKEAPGDYALYLGRLSEEKGVRVLLAAWQRLRIPVPLKIAGDGPLADELSAQLARQDFPASVEWLGAVPHSQIAALLRHARFLVVPSLCFENFPLAIAEAFACGLPVIASRLGACAEIVADSATGLLFTPADARDLGEKVSWAWAHPREMLAMGVAARAEYEAKYNSTAALRHLESIYERALRSRSVSSLPAPRPAYRVLGVRLDALQIPGVIAQMQAWIAQRAACRYIAVTDMHSLMQAQRSADFRHVLQDAALVVPDGYPLVWLARRKGFPLRRRVYGPELLERFCAATASQGYRHFFYGGAPGVAAQLAAILSARFPGIHIAGSFSPPFRPPTPPEDDSIVAVINAAAPDIVWVGLGAPKQERWMFDHCRRLQAPVLVGVGAAFDFHTGRVAQAPPWIRDHGFEWLFRLFQEPHRLWRRYLVYGTQFLCLVVLEALGLRKFP